VDRSNSGETWLKRLVYRRVTERHDITFPWGTAFSTDTVTRTFDYGPHPRSIGIFSGHGDRERCSRRPRVVLCACLLLMLGKR